MRSPCNSSVVENCNASYESCTCFCHSVAAMVTRSILSPTLTMDTTQRGPKISIVRLNFALYFSPVTVLLHAMTLCLAVLYGNRLTWFIMNRCNACTHTLKWSSPVVRSRGITYVYIHMQVISAYFWLKAFLYSNVNLVISGVFLS